MTRFSKFIQKNIFRVFLGIILVIFSLLAFSAYKKYSNRTKISKKFSTQTEIGFLVTSFSSENELSFALYTILYPHDKKIALYFLNPMITFDTDRLEKMGRDTPDIIQKKIETVLDKKIDYQFKLTDKNFERLIDILGGVNIFYDPYLLKKTSQTNELDIDDYSYSGRELTEFLKLKSKENPEDYLERLNRQEIITYIIFDKIQKLGKSFRKEWLLFLPNLIDSNFTADEYFTIYEFITENKFKMNLTEMPSELSYTQDSNKQKKTNLFIKDDIVNIAFNKFETQLKSEDFGDGEFSRIEILNGTDTSGLAKRVKTILNERRIKVLITDNAWQIDIKKSVIINRSGNSEFVKKVSDITGISNIKYVFNKTSGLDLTVVLGEDFEVKTGKK